MRTPGSKLEETQSALKHLEQDFNVKHMLLEGGAITCGNFLQMGLVDELSMIVYPGLDGESGHPSVIECQAAQEESSGINRLRNRRFRLRLAPL